METATEETKTEKWTQPIVFTKGNYLFNMAKWVLSAMSNDDTIRYYMAGVHIDEQGRWVATDGKRLHLWKEGPCYGSGGFFKATVTSKVITLVPVDDGFPNWENIMPDYPTMIIDGVNFQRKGQYLSAVDVFKLFTKTGACFNLNFLKDLGEHDWQVYGEEPDKSFHFKNGNLEAVIMPMQVSD